MILPNSGGNFFRSRTLKNMPASEMEKVEEFKASVRTEEEPALPDAFSFLNASDFDNDSDYDYDDGDAVIEFSSSAIDEVDAVSSSSGTSGDDMLSMLEELQGTGSVSTDRAKRSFVDDELDFPLDEIVAEAISKSASDIHIIADDYINVRIHGELERWDGEGGRPFYPMPDGDVMRSFVLNTIRHISEAELTVEKELDTSYVVKTGPARNRRLRMSVGNQMGSYYVTFRIISDTILNPEQLGLDEKVIGWIDMKNGLVLMAGTTGSGKSTTFASVIREIQKKHAHKIITIEKPVEYVFGNDYKAQVVQREVGRDTRSFAKAITSAMRQDPDLLLIGEVRDQEEVSAALRAAETGHLTFSTVHAKSVSSTVNRIISLFEGDAQRQIKSTLADNLRAVSNQVLVRTSDEYRESGGPSRVAVAEILEVTEEVADMIESGDVKGIANYQKNLGITLEHALLAAYSEGKCTYDEARFHCNDNKYFDELYEELYG